MPSFDELKNEAEGHPKEVDEGVSDLEKEADKETGGKDDSAIDKAGDEVEKEVGGAPSGDDPPQSTSPM